MTDLGTTPRRATLGHFAERLRVARAKAGVSSAEIARRCKVSPQAVSKWERGLMCPRSSHLLTICELCGCSLEWLMTQEPVDVRAPSAPRAVGQLERIADGLEEMARKVRAWQ